MNEVVKDSRTGARSGQEAPDEGGKVADAALFGVPAQRPFVVPPWLGEFGHASWLLIGLAVVLIAACSAISALRTLAIPLLFAALLGSTFMPVADRLERWGLKRWLATLVTMLLIVLIAAAIVVIVVGGVFRQFPTVQKNLGAAVDHAQSWLKHHDVKIDSSQIKSTAKKAGPTVLKGAFGSLVHGVQTIAFLIFGTFIGLNILAYILADGRGLGRWLSGHLPPVPQPTAYRIIAHSARFLRGYIWGSTIIGLFNGGVMFVGALIIGVPLAATIGIVGWATNYVPMFGAIIGGAFAVLIAFGSGGLTKALLMLVIVIISNGSLQTVVSQFALGAALKLHPLAVLFATTAGAILFGAVGGVVAAPFLKIAIDASAQLKATGLFGGSAAIGATAAGATAGEADVAAELPAPD